MAEPHLVLKEICKVFDTVVANDHINLKVERGEVHALLGENGAGKTTLMNILYGLYKPTSGEIFLNGEHVHIFSPKEAIRLGIGMVHQHFMLIPELSVVENLVLGMKSGREPFLDLKNASRQISELSEMYGLDIDPKSKVRDLPVGSQQRVEIVKALFRGADLLILDEPTAVLTPQETRQLGKIIETLTKQNKTVIFITHKLEEVMNMADKVTILRDGKAIANVDSSDYSKETLAQLMVGRPISDNLPRKAFNPGNIALDVKDLQSHEKRVQESLKGVSITVREGEILAVAGVDGNGQTELVESIIGLKKVNHGSITIYDTDVTRKSIVQRMDLGLAYIPQDRHKEGIALSMNLSENMIVETYNKKPFSNAGWLNYKKVNDFTDEMIREYHIKATGHEALGRNLSGGNQQKVVLARELSRNLKILVAVQPTRGLDVSAVEFVHTKILEARDEGMAILLISTELEECFSLCDRLVVMFEGKIAGELSRSEIELEKVGLMISGAYKEGTKTGKSEGVHHAA